MWNAESDRERPLGCAVGWANGVSVLHTLQGQFSAPRLRLRPHALPKPLRPFSGSTSPTCAVPGPDLWFVIVWHRNSKSGNHPCVCERGLALKWLCAPSAHPVQKLPLTRLGPGNPPPLAIKVMPASPSQCVLSVGSLGPQCIHPYPLIPRRPELPGR